MKKKVMLIITVLQSPSCITRGKKYQLVERKAVKPADGSAGRNWTPTLQVKVQTVMKYQTPNNKIIRAIYVE